MRNSRRFLPAILSLAFLLIASGCTTSFTNMTPSKALEPGHGQVSLSVASTAHTSTFSKTINAPANLSDRLDGFGDGPALSEDDYLEVIEVGTSWLLFTPGAAVEVMGRIGIAEVLEGLDLGFRYDMSVAKGDLKLQVLEKGPLALSVQAGYGYHSDSADIVGDYLQLAKSTRHDLDFMVSGGWMPSDNFNMWLAPRFMASNVTVEQALPEVFVTRLPDHIQAEINEALIRDEWLLYYGATIGMMAGIKPVYFTTELTLMSLAWEPTILGRDMDFDSFVLAPAFGLSVMW